MDHTTRPDDIFFVEGPRPSPSYKLFKSRSRTSGHYLWTTYQLHPSRIIAFQCVGGSSGWLDLNLTGRGRHWNFDPLQCLGPRPEILDRYISLSCLRWLPTACHERLACFHWPQWVTWLVTWWVTWSRWPDAGRHIGKFSLWTTLLRFSRSAQISPFSNFTKLGQLFFDNIFFGLTS